MAVLVLGIFLILFFAFISFRVMVLHPVLTLTYAVRDIYRYFRQRKYDYYDAGLLNCYFAHFGRGKTLSAVHYVAAIFRRYNNKRVWDRGQKRFVKQKVHIISNVHLNGIPYEELASLSQVVCCAWKNKKIDEENGTRTVVLVLLDEASSQLNSRNFKSNIDADFLNTLITSRHFHMSLIYTSQKFHLVDALLRSVTQTCISCNKMWRIMVQNIYSADDLEHASDPTMVKPYAKKGWFIRDSDFALYDTLATVDKLKRAVESGDMMTEKEIMEMRGNMNPDNEAVVSRSRKFKRLRKK